jgi:hypothetical protein
VIIIILYCTKHRKIYKKVNKAERKIKYISRGEKLFGLATSKAILSYIHIRKQRILLCHNDVNHCWGTGFPYGLYIRRTGHNPPREPNADRWVLT